MNTGRDELLLVREIEYFFGGRGSCKTQSITSGTRRFRLFSRGSAARPRAGRLFSRGFGPSEVRSELICGVGAASEVGRSQRSGSHAAARRALWPSLNESDNRRRVTPPKPFGRLGASPYQFFRRRYRTSGSSSLPKPFTEPARS